MKTGVLITARLKSERLPKKVMMPIKGRPMISHMIDRLRLAKRPEQIILCTSPLEQDDPLEELADQENIPCFRGDPDDVLLRLTEAAGKFGVDKVFNCTADNPLTDPIYLDRLIEFLIENDYDFAQTEGLPWGAYGWAISYPAMVRACEIKALVNTEVWGGYFTQTGRFKWGTLRAETNEYWPDLRLTVDTAQDFELVHRIFDEFYEPGEVFTLKQALDFCRRHPELVSINSGIRQKAPVPIKLKEPNGC